MTDMATESTSADAPTPDDLPAERWVTALMGSWRAVALLMLLALLPRLLLIVYLPVDAVSDDIRGWNQVVDVLQAGGNPYAETTRLNWPPVWMQALWVIDQASLRLNLELGVTIRLVLALLDTALVATLAAAMISLGVGRERYRWLLAGLVLQPALILLTCVHGNFDVIVALLVILALTTLLHYERSRTPTTWLWACLLIGLAILTKTVPMLLLGLLAPGLRRMSWSNRAMGLLFALGPVTLGMSVIFVLQPDAVAANVLGYRSGAGYFGLSGLYTMLGAGSLAAGHAKLFSLSIPLVILATGIWLWRRSDRDCSDHTLLLTPLIFMGLLLLGPGYGNQYAYWIIPPCLLAACLRRDLRWPIGIFLAVVAMQYIVEYTLNLQLGSLWYAFHRDEATRRALLTYSEPRTQTLLRLPILLAYIGLAAAFLRAFRRPSGETATSTA